MNKAWGVYSDIGALINYFQHEIHRFRLGLYFRNIGFFSPIRKISNSTGYSDFAKPQPEWVTGFGYKLIMRGTDLSRIRVYGSYYVDKDKEKHLDPLRIGLVAELRNNLNLSLGRYHYKPTYGFWFRAEHFRFGYTRYQEFYGTSRFSRRQQINMLALEIVL